MEYLLPYALPYYSTKFLFCQEPTNQERKVVTKRKKRGFTYYFLLKIIYYLLAKLHKLVIFHKKTNSFSKQEKPINQKNKPINQ